jgi:hypothetical protein
VLPTGKRTQGRPLHDHEVRAFMHIARQIMAIFTLENELDENYGAVKAGAFAWNRP